MWYPYKVCMYMYHDPKCAMLMAVPGFERLLRTSIA